MNQNLFRAIVSLFINQSHGPRNMRIAAADGSLHDCEFRSLNPDNTVTGRDNDRREHLVTANECCSILICDDIITFHLK